MQIGAFTQQFDLPLLLVQLFFLFFLCLVYHLRQEDKREGYPLVSHRTSRTGGRVEVVGFPPLPKPKAFLQPHDRPTVYAPAIETLPPIAATNLGNPNGMPIEPVGNPLLSRTGAASWTPKYDEPDLSWDGLPTFVPLRIATEFRIMKGDPDPRGFTVYGRDKAIAGHIVDIWVDKGEHNARFFEIELTDANTALREATADGRRAAGALAPALDPLRTDVQEGHADAREAEKAATGTPSEEARDRFARQEPGEPPRAAEKNAEAVWRARAAVPVPSSRVLLPAEFASVNGRARSVRSAAITAREFADIPERKADTILTAREEQQIRGYLGGGLLWGTTTRFGPLL